MTRIRVAAVRYLNTAPLIEGLDSLTDIELVTAVPSRIGDMVIAGEADIGLVSTIDAARAAVPLAMLPVGMIGSDGPTLTVRLFSDRPIDRIERVCADTDSHTSVVLCRILLSRLYGISPPVVDFDARERVARGDGPTEWPEAMLLIGDKVVTDSPPAVRYPHQLDLGAAWNRMTGLPFVYAVWMCRAGDLDREGPNATSAERLMAVAAMLDRQRRHNATRLDWLIARRAPEHRWPADLARRYMTEYLRYSVGPREREGVARFYSEAAASGFCPSAAPGWVSMGSSSDQAPEPSAKEPSRA